MTEDEMVGWHHQLDGHGFGWTPGVGDGQGGPSPPTRHPVPVCVTPGPHSLLLAFVSLPLTPP